MQNRWRGAFLSGNIHFQVFAMVRDPGRITVRLSCFWRAMYVISASLFAIVAPLAGLFASRKGIVPLWQLTLVSIVAAGCWIWLYHLLFRPRRIEIALESGAIRLFTRAGTEPDAIIDADEVRHLEIRESILYVITRSDESLQLMRTNDMSFVRKLLDELVHLSPLTSRPRDASSGEA